MLDMKQSFENKQRKETYTKSAFRKYSRLHILLEFIAE